MDREVILLFLRASLRPDSFVRSEAALIKYKKAPVKGAENSDKSPAAEVQDVLEYIKSQDAGSVEMKCTTQYLGWLKENIHDPDDLVINEGEMSNWEKLTASVKAGGGGRQTSRNARARTHLMTGIRASAEEFRQAYPNETIVMNKIRERLQKHLKNWKVILSASQTDEDRLKQAPVDTGMLEEEVLKRLAT